MELLAHERALFGFSTMVTSRNAAHLQDKRFYDELYERGCRIGLLAAYVPSAPTAPLTLTASLDQQRALRRRVLEMKRQRRFILMQMPEDEYGRDGTCMAAGRGFVHVTAHGDVEPCPFTHLADRSIAKVSLREALHSPLLRKVRESPELFTKPTNGCALFEHRDAPAQIGATCGSWCTDAESSPLRVDRIV